MALIPLAMASYDQLWRTKPARKAAVATMAAITMRYASTWTRVEMGSHAERPNHLLDWTRDACPSHVDDPQKIKI